MSASRGLGGDDYRLLVERSPAMIRRTGVDGRCDYVNDTWLAFTGRDIEDEIGDGWTRGVHPDDYALCIDLQRSHLGQRRAFEMQYRLRRHDGAFRCVHDREVPLFDDRGWFVGLLGTCVDCDDESRYQRTKSAFLTTVTEDLRRTLAAVKNRAAQFSRRASANQPLNEDAAERMTRKLDQLSALVEQLAAAARIESGTALVLDVGEVELTELVSDLVAAKTLSVSENRVPGAPGVAIETPDEPRPLRADGPKLARAIGNVIDNAVKFSRGGRVRVSLTSSSQYHAVSISDDGIGIPEEDLSRVTHPYVRGNNAASYPGAGLGLTVASEIVEAHGGRLQVDSAAPGGTRVTLILPRAARIP